MSTSGRQGRRTLRAALTQTKNAYGDMPARVEELERLAPRLEEVREANVAHHLDLMRAAHERGARVICFGELFTGPYFALTRDALWRGLAEPVPGGPTLEEVSAAARELSMVVVAPLYERDPDSGRRFNTAAVIDRGEYLGKYRKNHIPAGKNEQGAFHETFYYEPGAPPGPQGPADVSRNPHFPVFATSVGRIGVAICYDRHFPGVVWSLAEEGAELIFSPAVTFGANSRRMWPLEFQVDAMRHRVFIGGSNRAGAEVPWNQPFFGESLFAAPDGLLPDRSDHPELVIADLDLGRLSGVDPAGWDLARDERPEIYSLRPRRPARGSP